MHPTSHPTCIPPHTQHTSHLTPNMHPTSHPTCIPPHTQHASHLTPNMHPTSHPTCIPPHTQHASQLSHSPCSAEYSGWHQHKAKLLATLLEKSFDKFRAVVDAHSLLLLSFQRVKKVDIHFCWCQNTQSQLG